MIVDSSQLVDFTKVNINCNLIYNSIFEKLTDYKMGRIEILWFMLLVPVLASFGQEKKVYGKGDFC
jgi:hypothetical protein